ncbi:MAG: ORF6N domain-containing protein [Bdellovibrionota bacterium]
MPTRNLIAPDLIEQHIYLIRGHKVMLSTDLAALYAVEPRALVQAVKRNLDRFPDDFMFQLSKREFENLKSQIVTSSWGGLRRATPYAFTQEGVAMLSSVLRSKQAIQVNIAIMRAFVRLRSILAAHKELARKIEALERETKTNFKAVFELINKYLKPQSLPKSSIGFRTEINK